VPANYPLSLEALIRLGISQVQLKEGQAALNTLTPLVDRDKTVADQVYLWLARAATQVIPEPGQKAAYDKAVARAGDYYRQAAAKLEAQSGTDSTGKQRLGELLLEFVDMLLQVDQSALAGKVCVEINQKNLLPAKQEEVAQRLATALHLAGDYNGSDAVCSQFFTNYPQSALLPAVLFRFAENSYFRTLAAEKDPKLVGQLNALRTETIQRYQKLIDGYPLFPRAQNARFAIGQLLYSQGDFAKAQAAFETIPSSDRAGELAIVGFLLADCMLRQVPAGVPEDALAAGKLEASLKSSVEMLDAFAAAQPNGPQTAEALMRLGQTLQRLASLQAQLPERNRLYTEARTAFEKLLQPQFARNPLQAQALLERARCRVGYGGDMIKSMAELRQFLVEPLKQTAAAPLAVVQLATWLRTQNKHGEAVAMLFAFNVDYAKRKGASPAMLGLLAYHKGLAMRDAGQLVPAHNAFAEAVKLIPDQAEGLDAALRSWKSRSTVSRTSNPSPTRRPGCCSKRPGFTATWASWRSRRPKPRPLRLGNKNLAPSQPRWWHPK